MRGTAAVLGAGMWLVARSALAGEPTPGAAPSRSLPTDGDVAFSYSRAADVKGCTQPDEADVRFLIEGVIHVTPFVPAGKPAPYTVLVHVTGPRAGVVRAKIELRDAAGVSKGTTSVEDRTCDDAHMKLAAAIALLLVPRPAAATPPSAGTASEEEGREAANQEGSTPAGAGSATDGARKEGASQGTTAPAGTTAKVGARAGASATSAATPSGPGGPARQPVCKKLLAGYCLGVDIYSFAFALGGSMSLGFTADPGAGMWLNAEVRPVEPFSIALELRGLFPSRVVAVGPAKPGEPHGTPKEPLVSNATTLLVPCFRYWWLMGCAVGHLGFSIAQTPAGFTGWPVVGAGPRVGIDIPITDRFFVRGQGDVLFNFTDTGLYLVDENIKWQQNIVSGFIGIGLGVALR